MGPDNVGGELTAFGILTKLLRLATTPANLANKSLNSGANGYKSVVCWALSIPGTLVGFLLVSPFTMGGPCLKKRRQWRLLQVDISQEVMAASLSGQGEIGEEIETKGLRRLAKENSLSPMASLRPGTG
jgi:hypothetical protein